METWKPIDFVGIISLNQAVVDHLHRYLMDKETQLSHHLLETIHPHQSLGQAPLLEPAFGLPMKLSDAVEGFSKQLRQTTQSGEGSNDWKAISKQVNRALWEYLETLEVSVTELFQQVAQVGIEDWRLELAHVIEAIKEMIMHRLDDLRWAIARLGSLLKEYRSACKRSMLKMMGTFWQPPLDRALNTHLTQCQRLLEENYQRFSSRFKRFMHMQSKINHSLEKFSWYRVFTTLEHEAQTKLKKIYSLLKFWEMNRKTKSVSQNEPTRALRAVVSPDKAIVLFREYYHALNDALYRKSRAIKENPELAMDPTQLNDSHEEILTYRGELKTLGTSIKNYRNFLLATDPKAPIGHRWKFPEWLVGREPAIPRQLSNLQSDVEKLDLIFETFRQAVERKPLVEESPFEEIQEEVQYVLHEMGQPLLSRAMMKVRAERLVNLLERMDELTSLDAQSVEEVQNALSKALRLDWKHHVLFDIPPFHQVYAIHQGVLGRYDDRIHLNRVQKFRRHIQQIEHWIKDRETPKHTHEIEEDMNDIKGYLQDFLAQVQRVTPDDKFSADASRQLLEYRYMFGNFFHHLREDKPEERMIRRQFLFVDQYFEAIENRLHDWKTKQNT